jgi:hypothetical protein
MAKRRKAVNPGAKPGAVKARLKRRAVVIGGVGLLSVVGVILYDVGREPTTHVVILNLTDGPVTDIQLTGMKGRWRFDQIGMARAESFKIARSPDSRYAFHIKYKEGGAARETDIRMLAGRSAVSVIELAINPSGVSTSLRSEETAADRIGRFVREVRGRIGL